MEDKKKIQIEYKVPEGYFLQMEDKVRDRIHASEEKTTNRSGNPAWGIVKPALLLVCMFVAIFGIGYGTMALTGTLGYEKSSEMVAESDAETSTDATTETEADEEIIEYLSETMSTAAIESYIAENL